MSSVSILLPTVIPAILGGIGLMCVIYRKTVLGFLIGVQILVLGAASAFVFVGSNTATAAQGHAFGFFIILGSVGQLVVGFSLAIRLFYLKKKTGMDELRSLRH